MKSLLLLITGIFILPGIACQLQAQRKQPVLINRNTIQVPANKGTQQTSGILTSCTQDTILITSQAQIDNFAVDYPTCSNPKYLIIDGAGASPAITNLNGFLASSLGEVQKKLKIVNTSLTSMGGLNNLYLIDTLDLQHNPLLTTLGLFNLDSLGAINFIDLPVFTDMDGLCDDFINIRNVNIDSTALTTLNGLSNIENITDGLFIAHTPLTSLSGMASLTSMGGWINVTDDPALTSIGLHNLTRCNGFLFWGLPNLTSLEDISHHLVNTSISTFWMIQTGITDLSGLDSLTSVPNFYLWSNPNLASAHGLEKVQGNVAEGISIHDNPLLTDITALSGITAVSNGTLEIDSNPLLTSLTGLGNITDIGKGLWIVNNPGLTTLAGLDSTLVVHNIDDQKMKINDNSQLAVCNFPPVCNYIASGESIEINNNAPGCASLAEVTTACNLNCSSGDEKTWNGQNSNDWNDPDNWTPAGVPALCTKVIIPSYDDVPNTPLAAGNISIGGLVMESGAVLNMDGYELTVTKTFNLHNSTIFSGSSITATRIFEPVVNSSYLEGNFTCEDYGGHAEFFYNTFYGNTVLSDSTGRTESSSTSFNTFHGNLTFINNSDYGNNYLSNASPLFDYIEGDLLITNNSAADISVGLGAGRPLKVQGNFIVNASNGLVDINNLTFVGGTFNPHTTQLGSNPIRINNLFMEAGAETRLDQSIEINNSLVFDNGSNKINTTSANLLILNSGTTVTRDPANNRGFVNGPMKKRGNQAFTFPVGKYEFQYGGDNYGPISISAPANATDEFTAEYFHHNPGDDGYDTSLYTPGFGGISGKEYWKLTRDNGNAEVEVTLSYDSARSGIAYLFNDMQVAGWNGSLWRSWGTGGFTGTIASGTVISDNPLTDYGPLTLSFKPVRIPVITLGEVDSIPCAGTYFSVPFSLDTAMIAGNVFKAEISDSLGVFSPVSNSVLGTKAGITSDTIQAYMPFTLNFGSHYKIRVTGTLPRDTSVNSKTVIPGRVPQQTFNIIGTTPACIGNGLQKYYPSLHEPNTVYTWTLSGGGTFTTNGDTAIVNWTTTGTYNLTCKSSNYCGNGPQKILSVEVKPAAPTATATIYNTGRWLFSSQVPSLAGYQWYRNGIIISGAVNSSYYASLAGIYTVKFENYCGAGPASNTISFAANSIPQTINFPAIPNKTYGDAPFVPNATATSGLPVSLTLISGPATINPQTNLLTITGTGLVTIRANQIGDEVYDTAAPVTRSFTINKATQVITFPAIPEQDISSSTVALLASSTSALPVTYTIIAGPATVSGNIVTFTALGTVTVRASQNGDTNYLPATAVDRSFCIRVADLAGISGYTNLCPGTATYTINNVPGATYLWRIAGGATLPSGSNSTNVTWTIPGTYSLIVSASGPCGAASNNDTLVVTVISSIQPDSVQSMLPPNGAINQQLPLTLSWVPAHPGSFYTFDLYLWRADLPQPGTPYAANLTAINYTLPVNSGLTTNQPYKWMVVSHNGSCTQINTGPVQQFILIPLPDLVVQNVQAPATAFSGQTISINWTVRNPGPGKTTTNQNWTDGVFLTFDTLPNFSIPPQTNPAAWGQLDFPSRPLLIAAKPNVSALDSGQQYSNSVNFTLPLSYSLPLYAYVITNYPSGSNAPQQVTKVNDTARAPQPIVVSLSPTPDLRVDTVFTPTTTFSGSTINVTYKVKNHGVLTPAGATWTDKVYISQSPLFNINTAIPVKLPKPNGTYYANAVDAFATNTSQLPADSTYSRSMQVVVPNYIFGTWFIYVFANTGDTLYEGALNNNNVNRSQVQVFLTPTPHLKVSSLTLPATTASTTQPIGVNWNITNTGFNDNIEKNKGHYFVQSGTCVVSNTGLPGILITDSLGFGSSYWADRVYLSTDAGGLNIANAVLVSETIQGVPNSGSNSGETLLTYPCQPGGTNPGQLNVNTFNVIKPGSNHPQTGNFTVPSTLPQGSYYVYVLANASRSVFEYPGTPETRRSTLPITVQRPDATVSTITVPANSTGGQALAINYSILNSGPGTVFNHVRRDKIYVSASPVFNGSAQLIDSAIFTEDLPVGTAVSHTLNYTFPVSTSGTRYFYVHTNFDSAFRENNANNNISIAAATLVTPAAPCDLVVSNIQMGDTVYAIFPSGIKYTVTNNGTAAAAGTWTDSIYISCSPTFNPATSYYIAKRSHGGIVSAGSGYTDSFNVNMPFAFYINNCFPQINSNTAYFFIKTNAGNTVYEGSNGNNNLAGTGARVLINPSVDHMVTSVTGPDTATVARPYPAGWTVKNIGYNPGPGYYSGWYDAIYFSPDSVFNSNAVLASGYFETTPLNTNQVYNETRNAIPPNIPTGDYYVFARTNYYPPYGIAHETIVSNNGNLIRNGGGAAKKIHVIQPLLPDLTDSIISGPSLIAVGQPVTIVHRVTNNGSGITYPANWSDDLWLSTDFFPGNNGSDILLAGRNHAGALQPGQWYTDTVTATIPMNVAPGNYILISRVNATNNLFESSNTNNLAFKYVTVYSPAPADLVVENILKPDSVFLGYTLDTAKWVVKNISPNAAIGASSDGIYLSASGQLDSTAVLLGIKNKIINMGPFAMDTISMSPLVTNVTEGNYHVIVKTDLLNNIVESNKDNNTGVATTPIYVKVKELPLAVLTPNTLHTISRFYKLVIPDSLSGATIQVILKSGDSLTMKNQMFIGKGYIPSPAHFDYTYSTPNYGNQEIVMASVTTGVYYITIRCASANPVVQNITLKAVKLPFAILNVHTSSGGNSGNVTVKVSGSLFVNSMTAVLSKPGTTINASAVYFINSTTVYATFNLQGKPLGIYDVTLTKPDSSMATLVNGFSVVTPNNGGLITGGGVNTGPGNGNAPGCAPGAASGLNSQLVTEIVAPERVLIGWPFVIQINYSNPTNVDIPAQARTLYSDHNVLMALTPAGVATGTTSLYLELTEQDGPPGIIRAGGSGSILVYSKMHLSLPRGTVILFNLK